MFTIFFRSIKDKKISILVYCFASVLFLWMYVALFPSISESFGQLKGYLETFPKGFLDAFGLDAETFVTFEGFIGSEQFSFIWPIMTIALAISLAGGMIASEVEKGTVEILLAQPVSRLKLFFSKYLSGAFAVFLFVFVSIGAIFPLTAIYDISIKQENFLKLGFLGFLLGLSVFSISMLCSAVFSEKSRANFIPAGIMVLMYVANILAGLKDNLSDLKYISFFYYFMSSKILVYGDVTDYAWWVFGGISLVSAIAAAFWFSKRDIAV